MIKFQIPLIIHNLILLIIKIQLYGKFNKWHTNLIKKLNRLKNCLKIILINLHCKLMIKVLKEHIKFRQNIIFKN